MEGHKANATVTAVLNNLSNGGMVQAALVFVTVH